jgi:hypothetical protein
VVSSVNVFLVFRVDVIMVLSAKNSKWSSGTRVPVSFLLL